MSSLTGEKIQELESRERLVLAVDTDERHEVIRLSGIAKGVGAISAKYGLEVVSALGLAETSRLAEDAGLEWIADLKLQFDDDDNVERVIEIAKGLEHPPFGITIHVQNEKSILQRAVVAADETILFGVTALTSIKDGDGPGQSKEVFGKERSLIVPEFATTAALMGLSGIVCSPREVNLVKLDPVTSPLIVLSPGVRSGGADAHDQGNTETPEFAMAEGADLLVIGRQVTKAEDPVEEFLKIGEEADRGMTMRRKNDLDHLVDDLNNGAIRRELDTASGNDPDLEV